MNVVTTTWQQLMRRRLWPLALLLVAALVAVPFVLASEPAPVTPPAPAPVVDEGDALAEPVVAKVAAGDRTRRRRVLGARKDPFAPAPVPKAKKKKTEQAASAKQDAAPSESKSPAPTTTSGGGGSTAPSTSTPPSSEPSPRKPPAGSVTVRFGDATGEDLPSGWLTKLSPLPDDEEPLLVYLGLTKNGKKAKFLVDAALTPTGDGTCKPHPSSCETVLLSRGETEFFDAIDPASGEPTAQYQLDLVAINK